MPHKDREKRLEYARRYNELYRVKGKASCACGAPIWRQSKQCRSCAAKARPSLPPRWKTIDAICPYCAVPMRLNVWHGQKIHHCPSCGLETTEMALRRIRHEEAA